MCFPSSPQSFSTSQKRSTHSSTFQDPLSNDNLDIRPTLIYGQVNGCSSLSLQILVFLVKWRQQLVQQFQLLLPLLLVLRVTSQLASILLSYISKSSCCICILIYILKSMVIIGLVGLNCSGKTTFAEKVNQLLNYKKIDLTQDSITFDKILSNWLIPTVVYPITTRKQIDSLAKRQYFHLVFIDAPINLRYKRYSQKHKDKPLTFEQFIELDDTLKFTDRLIDCIKACKVKILNDHRNLEDVILKERAKIDRPFRPSWEVYFMRIAYNLKQRSNCMKKSVGAVLVDKYKRIISTSYNGTPKVMKNCNQGGCDICNQEKSLDLILYKCMCIHAEEGCILEAGVAASRGSSIYTTLFPCVWCCKALLQAVGGGYSIKNYYQRVWSGSTTTRRATGSCRGSSSETSLE